jgi:hypothetical protein
MFALLDIELSKVISSPKEALTDMVNQLQQKGGLDYLPRERTP